MLRCFFLFMCCLLIGISPRLIKPNPNTRIWCRLPVQSPLDADVSEFGLIVYEITGEADPRGEAYLWTSRVLDVTPCADVTDSAMLIYTDFFVNAAYCVPENVQICQILLADGCLTLDVSDAILRYGGNAYEQALIAQLLRNALSLPGITCFTLRVEGSIVPLAEGRTVECLR